MQCHRRIVYTLKCRFWDEHFLIVSEKRFAGLSRILKKMLLDFFPFALSSPPTPHYSPPHCHVRPRLGDQRATPGAGQESREQWVCGLWREGPAVGFCKSWNIYMHYLRWNSPQGRSSHKQSKINHAGYMETRRCCSDAIHRKCKGKWDLWRKYEPYFAGTFLYRQRRFHQRAMDTCKISLIYNIYLIPNSLFLFFFCYLNLLYFPTIPPFAYYPSVTHHI